MRLLYTCKTPDVRSVSKLTTWLVYTECIYFNYVIFYNSPQPITTFNNWLKSGELVRIEKPI